MSALSDMLNEARIAEQRRAMTHAGQYDNDRARSEAWNELRTAPGRLAQGAFTGLVGAPVDIANMVLTPIGLGSERPVGGSNYLADLINAPTDSAAYQAGTMLPISPEGLALGGAKLAGLAGIFAGKGAKTANLAELVRAEEMAKDGVPDAQIWNQTGWTLNTPDKMPRFEIPDNAATAQYTHLSERGADRLAPRAIEHQELYRAYPDANDITQLGLRDSAETGSMDSSGGFLTAKAPTEQGLKSVGIHELQHAIQQREGFARGGSPESASAYYNNDVDKIRSLIEEGGSKAEIDELRSVLKKTYGLPKEELYKRLAGEAEARLTQARMNMTPEERLAQYPFEPDYFKQSTGVNLDDLIVRKDGGVAMSASQYKGFDIAGEGKQFPVGQTAIRLKDGTVLTDASPIHALQIKKLNDQGIPTSEIESGGFIRDDGSYIAGSADTPRIIEQDRAKRSIAERRAQRLAPSKTEFELAHEVAQRNAARGVK